MIHLATLPALALAFLWAAVLWLWAVMFWVWGWYRVTAWIAWPVALLFYWGTK